ncbi:ABC transporter permease [Caulobacter rhizosphaerae]|jgi:ABC-type polysaccharide/polyol phosphate export permease|uniref:ABC-type polysaccharide/polyol phosphate export permease n=1 Tax=Caulobacter rhizosphaerae TaxID=2010972 RepID=A0ABU1N2N1_9CAUL|nr:ABC transporter permease [Caulobacter rhizosphaerae]MDR6532346.1 ABC-type polysaccharide/polyol phosphate export permease [Caulobacter rhizosphaerae]GGL22770.1 putative O-antigen/lipopolysaccharide transport integral membrane protein ABC transporter RfbD [Caulobacter rhizosphaerae]
MSRASLSSAVSDISSGIGAWRIWTALALTDIKTRYRRSLIGQFWITISMGLTIAALAIVYSQIFRISLSVYVPLITVSFICWGLLASFVNDSAMAFLDAEGYIRTSTLPKATFVYRMIARNTVVFAHNLILIPIVMLIFRMVPDWHVLLFVPAFLLTLLNGIWIALILGPISARFRDMPLMVSSLTQIAFFVSPVMWERKQLSAQGQLLVNANPFAIFLELLREPLLGRAPSAYHWAFAIGLTLVGWAAAILLYSRLRARIAFYL